MFDTNLSQAAMVLQSYACLAMYPIGLDPGLDQQIDQLDLRHASALRTCLVITGLSDPSRCFWTWPWLTASTSWLDPRRAPSVGSCLVTWTLSWIWLLPLCYCPAFLAWVLWDGALLLPAMLSPTAPLPLLLPDTPILTANDECDIQPTQLKVPRLWKTCFHEMTANIHNKIISVKC